MKILYIILLCSIFITIGLSKDLKDIRIVKILDSNLFLSEEGLLIKLAYIQSPSVFSEDSLIAKKIIKYAKWRLFTIKFQLSIFILMNTQFFYVN